MKRIQIFGKAPFDVVTKKELLENIVNWARRSQRKLVLNMNAYGVVTFLKNKKYASAIRKADLIYPDGWGPVVVSRFLKEELPERVNVGDFIHDLLLRINNLGLKIYLLGVEPEAIQKTTSVIEKKYPQIIISGNHHGFFSKKEENEIVEEIRKTKPNLVLVGMGVPKQELWIVKNWKRLPNSVYMGVGGVFYYIAGIKSRAPQWLRDMGLEWFYRLLQEPRRLWKRYTLYNILFVYHFLKSFLKERLNFLLIKR